MPHLIFCATSEGMTRRIAERQEADGIAPFVLRKGTDVAGAIEALRADRNVVADAHAGSVGWHAPDGVSVELDEDMNAPGLLALRVQSEGRVHRMRSGPVRVEMLIPGETSDRRIAQILNGKISDPFSGASAPCEEPGAP